MCLNALASPSVHLEALDKMEALQHQLLVFYNLGWAEATYSARLTPELLSLVVQVSKAASFLSFPEPLRIAAPLNGVGRLASCTFHPAVPSGLSIAFISSSSAVEAKHSV